MRHIPPLRARHHLLITATAAASEDDIWGTADEQPRKKTRASASRNEMNDEYQGRQSRKSK